MFVLMELLLLLLLLKNYYYYYYYYYYMPVTLTFPFTHVKDKVKSVVAVTTSLMLIKNEVRIECCQRRE